MRCGFAGSEQIPLPFLGPGVTLPISAIVVTIAYVGISLFLRKAAVGRHIYAVGGNPNAARVSGINVDRVLLLVYALCGFFAGTAGLLTAGRTNSGFPLAGTGAELEAIAAVIIGGASFFGGRGSVLGVMGGVLIMGLLRNGLNLQNVSVFWQQLADRLHHHPCRLGRRTQASRGGEEMTTDRRTFSGAGIRAVAWRSNNDGGKSQ